MMRPTRAESTAPSGVIASFAAGFSLLLAAPLPMLIPVTTDALLLTGPRVSPTSLAAPIADAVAQAPNADPAITEFITAWANDGNLLAIVGWFVPSLVAGLDAVGIEGFPRAAAWSPDPGAALLVILGAILAAVLLVMLYKTLAARVAAETSLLGDRLIYHVGRNALHYLAFLALMLLAGLVLIVPSGILIAVLQIVGIDLTPLITFVLSTLVIVGAVLFAFVAEAIAANNLGPIAAIRSSIKVVTGSVGQTIGLLIISWLVLATTPQVVARFDGGVVGIAIAVLIYAFVAAGVAVARMIFYRERAGAPLPPSRSETA